MKNEEYEKALEKVSDFGNFLFSIIKRCYIAENARLKVGDIITPYDSKEPYKITGVCVVDYGYDDEDEDLIDPPDHVPDDDICYEIECMSCQERTSTIRQKELFKSQQQ